MNVPKSWTKVTPVSKTIAFILFISLPILGFYLGMQYQYSIDMYNQYTQTSLTIPVHTPVIITLQQSQKTIYTKVGDTVVLNLSQQFRWGTPRLSSSNVLATSTEATSVAQPTAVYKAVAPGTVTIATTGTPQCKKGQICSQMQLAITFAITIVVSK